MRVTLNPGAIARKPGSFAYRNVATFLYADEVPRGDSFVQSGPQRDYQLDMDVRPMRDVPGKGPCPEMAKASWILPARPLFAVRSEPPARLYPHSRLLPSGYSSAVQFSRLT